MINSEDIVENKDRILERNHIKAGLDLERTILAKQRTILAEINVFLGSVGLGFLMLKFFDYLPLKIMGVLVSSLSIFMITRLFHKYNRFKRKVRKIEKRNGFHKKDSN